MAFKRGSGAAHIFQQVGRNFAAEGPYAGNIAVTIRTASRYTVLSALLSRSIIQRHRSCSLFIGLNSTNSLTLSPLYKQCPAGIIGYAKGRIPGKAFRQAVTAAFICLALVFVSSCHTLSYLLFPLISRCCKYALNGYLSPYMAGIQILDQDNAMEPAGKFNSMV